MSAAVRTEAIRKAKADIKKQIRLEGFKLNCFRASDITKWSRQLVVDDPRYLRNAKRRLKRRQGGRT